MSFQKKHSENSFFFQPVCCILLCCTENVTIQLQLKIPEPFLTSTYLPFIMQTTREIDQGLCFIQGTYSRVLCQLAVYASRFIRNIFKLCQNFHGLLKPATSKLRASIIFINFLCLESIFSLLF